MKTVDPKDYDLTSNKLRGSSFFVLKKVTGEESLVQYPPTTTIESIILAGGGTIDDHVAKFGSTILDPHKSLENYKINTNGSLEYQDLNWDGRLSVVHVTKKGVLANVLDILSHKTDEYSLKFLVGEAIGLGPNTIESYVILSIKNSKGKQITAETGHRSSGNPVWNNTLYMSAPWLTLDNYNDFSLKITVYGGRDIPFGEIEVPLDLWMRDSSSTTWFPLNSSGWIRMEWIRDHNSNKKSFWDGSSFFGNIDTSTRNYNSQVYTCFRSTLPIAIQYLQAEFFKSSETKNQLTIVLKDHWPKFSNQFKEYLLSRVDRLILEVTTGVSTQDLMSMLSIVKNSNVQEIYLLDIGESIAIEEGMRALQDSKNIKSFKYLDNKVKPNAHVVEALTELISKLPSLEELILSFSTTLWSDSHLKALLSNLKIKSLVFENIPVDTDINFKFLTTNIEEFVIHFKETTKNTGESNTATSLCHGLKHSNLKKLVLENLQFTPTIAYNAPSHWN